MEKLAQLSDIRDYVWKTSKIIASVLNEEVVICDDKMKIIGDSKCQEYETLSQPVSKESILRVAIKEKQIITINNVKETAEGCKMCNQADDCDINSIIAFPIKKNFRVTGCIALYSKEVSFEDPNKGKEVFLVDFISKMSELLISKLDEKNENIKLKAMQERMSSVIEHLDTAVAVVDENSLIIHTNSRFRNMFKVREKTIISIEEIEAIRNCNEFLKFLKNSKKNEKREFQFKMDKTTINVISNINEIKVDSLPVGRLIFFKNASKVYEEINQATNNYSEGDFDDVIGRSKVIMELKEKAKIYSKSSSTVLIQGESGTGKEIFARAIHSESYRSKEPFVTVNCAAIPDNLLESELFGYEEGSFTGAVKGGRIGKFQLANNGTLFLDEIGEMQIHLQVKLLRVIQEKEIQKVGSIKDETIDIRIIAATNKNLEERIASGEFREDLYYRLNVIPIVMPALRDRKSDIPLLINTFLEKYNRRIEKDLIGIQKDALNSLMAYNWPGNVRELQNTVEYCVNMARGQWIEEEDLPPRIRNKFQGINQGSIRTLDEIERFYIREALQRYGNTLEGKEKAAKELGIGIATLYRKIKDD